MRIAVFYLAWGPLGTAMARRFADSYRSTRAGVDHSLTIIHNGVPAERLDEMKAVFADMADAHVVPPRPILDMEAYRWALEGTDADVACFLNSYTRVMVPDWLAKLTAPLAGERAGVTGAMGSNESLFFRRRFPLPPGRGFWRQAVDSMRSIWRYPPAPNPHLRLNVFAGRVSVLRDVDWPAFRTKEDSLRFESGRRSLTRQVLEAGRELLVVDAAGRTYPPGEWERSETFRLGTQSGLLLADNRSDEYAAAAPGEARELAALAWGKAAR